MSLAGAVHSLIVDIDNLHRLFQQISGAPKEVELLFQRLNTTYSCLIELGGQLAARDISILFDRYVLSLKKFRSNLLDLELYIDPQQILPRSGFGSRAENAVPWNGPEGPGMVEYCKNYEEKLLNLDDQCLEILLTFDPKYLIRKDVAAKEEMIQSFTPPISILPSPFLQSPFSTMSSPLLNPDMSPIRLSPMPSPAMGPQAATPMTLLNLMSGTQAPSPIILPNGDTLGHLPASARIRRTRRPGNTLADRRVQQMLDQQYGGTMAAGIKRKRDGCDSRPEGVKSPVANAPFPPNGSPLQQSTTPPPSYPPSLPRLHPQGLADDREYPTWSLDDLHSSLPSIPPRPNVKGKQRATNTASSSADTWESGSSVATGSSANSIRSSLRDGSILSTASHDRAFTEGSVKLWYHRGVTLQQVTITHIEVRQTSRPGGDGIVLILRTSKGQDIIQDLWISSLQTNASPFLENAEIEAAMRDQHDTSITALVHFAPNTARHPQYSFASRTDCWDFLQMVVGKTLIASVDISTLKSALTHGHAAEAGCQTIQVWESHESAAPARTVKFFRNKNAHVASQVVELDVNCLRAPEKEGRSGKLVFMLRDVLDGRIREMKYLKISFASDSAKDMFVREAGFSHLVNGSRI
ncbi:hypothetical protein BT63DRAFT_96927 [Microthyrium microscopicum]|uniref:Uncharacterized protein n=1 Tax=Microthyrium microscopicum TaxID=703497 RepID=A0A6A6TZJ0_9PEZI|nr:hypothetical protein BT63DRAFT_96927 [Microthyrium microscopicum]